MTRRLAALLLAGLLLGAAPPFTTSTFPDPVLGVVRIQWRCVPAGASGVAYEGYIDAEPAGPAATVFAGKIWLGDRGLAGSSREITLRQINGIFSPATGVPIGPSGSENLMPFRILRGKSSCAVPTSLYWWPADGRNYPLSGAHEYPLT
jgi:hypothetical protein